MTALQCGQISKEESEFLRRSCSARTPVGIMETLHGKASALSAGEREHVQLEPRGKTQGKHAASNDHSDSKEHNIFVSCNDNSIIPAWWCLCVNGLQLHTVLLI